MTTTDRGATVGHDHGIPRSSKWKTARRNYIKAHPFCEACGPTVTRTQLEVHHRIPYHLCGLLGRPELEFDARNFIVLCEDDGVDHHLLLGHLDSFQTSNKSVQQSVLDFFGSTAAQIRGDTRWLALKAAAPKAWEDMTDDDKAAMKAAMDVLCPI